MSCHEGTFYKGWIWWDRWSKAKDKDISYCILNEEAPPFPLWMKYGKEKAKGR